MACSIARQPRAFPLAAERVIHSTLPVHSSRMTLASLLLTRRLVAKGLRLAVLVLHVCSGPFIAVPPSEELYDVPPFCGARDINSSSQAEIPPWPLPEGFGSPFGQKPVFELGVDVGDQGAIVQAHRYPIRLR